MLEEFHGQVNDGSIENCYNIGNIKGVGYSFCVVGGVAGRIAVGAKINNSYNRGNVQRSVAINKYLYVGGICGENGTMYSNRGSISNSYCINNVTYSYYYCNSSNKRLTTTTGIVTEDTLKGYAEVLGEEFEQDSQNINNGYPVLKWQSNIKK